MNLWWVALGGAVGASVRLLVDRALTTPRGTFAVNVAGSGLLGALHGSGPVVTALVGAGFCGALTTYSTFAVEAVRLRSWRYVLGTVVACAAAASLSRYVVD